jgi:predicted DNA-binding transcriptional regulator AlpA
MPDATRLAFSIGEFCAAVGISRATYYTLPPDQRPREMHVGARRVLISRQAADEWIAAREGRHISTAA